MGPIFTDPRMIIAISMAVAVIIGYFIKRHVDWEKVKPIIAIIIGLIFKVETDMPGKGIGSHRKDVVVAELEKRLANNDKGIINKVFGSIPNAVEFAFTKFAGKAIKRGWSMIFK